MREFKFRAWDGKKMCRIEQWNFRNPSGVGIRGSDGKGTYTEIKIPIMQYTGLTDKKGKEIYEGDICKIVDLFAGDEYEKFKHRLGLFGKIVYVNAAFEFETLERGNELLFLDLLYENSGADMSFEDSIDSDSLEVVGNIYENPNLVKE